MSLLFKDTNVTSKVSIWSVGQLFGNTLLYQFTHIYNA